jgi:uncharacterized repeat protein (TIGR01451 family)
MLLSLFITRPKIAATDSVTFSPPPPRPGITAESQLDELIAATPMDKIDPSLRRVASTEENELIDVYVSTLRDVDLSTYLVDIIVRPEITTGIQYIFGKTRPSVLMKIATHPGVISIVDGSLKEYERPYDSDDMHAPDAETVAERIEFLRANEQTGAKILAPSDIDSISGWFDVQDGHKSRQAWDKGFTGEGVIVGVIDDGIDFAHPDLIGTTARVNDPDSPYLGWPMAFSQASLQYFARDVYLGQTNIANGKTSSRWSDTQTTQIPAGGIVTFQPLGASTAFAYQVTGTSLSNQYKIGSLPEGNLRALYGHRVAILVVDESNAGIYDTVYVDLDNDKDFRDEKPNTKASPEIYRDMDGDGFADISGGMLVWISDGANSPPVADWLWGIDCGDNSPTMKGCPDNGELILFSGALRAGYTHGTLCASNIAARGVVSQGLTAQPFRTGGMVQGAAPNVGLMDFGDFYLSFTGEDHYLVATLGYDGVANSGDEVQIASNSYGAFGQMWGGWGYIGRLLTSLNLTVGENTVYLFSVGNEGPGYGPQEGDIGPTTIQVGSSTQFGSTNWDSIFGIDQIVYGDPSAFYSKGPNRDGSVGVDVLANGGRGAGDEGINYYGYNGAASWDTWGGTSRSSPVAAGNLALVFEAFEKRYGRWPTWYEAKVLLKSSATNSVSSPFLQGGGVVNADRATDLAAGVYGLYATPDEWRVGNWEGIEHLNFANVVYPGSVYTKTYQVTNPSDYTLSVDLADGVMTRISSREYSLQTSDLSAESADNPHTPDYLLPVPSTDIPPDTEVMVVRYLHTYASFDPQYDFTPNPDSAWRFLLYNWTDQDGDDLLWEDKNSNGVVNHVDDTAAGLDNDGFYRPDFSHPDTEIDPGEYVRMDDEYGGMGASIIVHDPLARMSDGYYFGLQHRYRSGEVPSTVFRISVEFYKRTDWEWLSLSASELTIAPRSTSAFEADMSIPESVEPGAYEGVIYMYNPGDEYHPAHETALPIIVNVIAKLMPVGTPVINDDSEPKSVSLGGRPMTEWMYQNSWTYGYFNWYGSAWTGAGDWRHYFLDLDATDFQKGNLLIHTWWNDGYPTDINTWVLGPTEDCASNGVDPCAWWEPGSGQPNQEDFGPYTLQPIASSGPLIAGTAYPFETTTGGPDDWLVAPLEREGLHEIALHNVLYSGGQITTQFGVDIGTIDVDATIAPEDGLLNNTDMHRALDVDSYVTAGAIDLLITPSLALPDLEFTLTNGMGSTSTTIDTTVYDSNGCLEGPNCMETIWIPFELTHEGSTHLEIFHQQPQSEDIDLFLYFDEDENNDWDADIDTYLGASTYAAGKAEYIEVTDPITGTYLLGLLGWDLSLPSLLVDWSYAITHPEELSSEPRQVLEDVPAINQDNPADFHTASFSTTLTTDERTSAIQVDLYEIPVDANIDIYITDSSDTVVAQSNNSGNADETARIEPPEGEYRLGAGQEYTLWVHGSSVPTAPAHPGLGVTFFDRNIWLSSDHPDVTTMDVNYADEISVGETVTVTLNYARSDWEPGDEYISARLEGGPSVLPDAFDQLITIRRVDTPSPTPAAAFSVTQIPGSNRGLYPGLLPDIYRFGPAQAALVAPDELVTYVLTVTNDGDASGAFLLDDYWGNEFLDFVDVLAPTGAYTETYTYGTDPVWEGLIITDTLEAGTSATITVTARATANIQIDHFYPNFADVYDYTTTGYFETSWAGVLYRDFSTSSDDGFLAFSEKHSSDEDGRVVPAQLFDYEINLQNPSSEDVTLTVIDPLPPEINFVKVNTGDLQYDLLTHTVTWTGVLPGSTVNNTTLSFQVQVIGAVSEGTLIFNEAEVRKEGEPIAYLDDTLVVDDLLDPDIKIEKFVDRLIIPNSDSLQFTITIRNEGIDTALNVNLIDPIPEGITIDVNSIFGGAHYSDGAVYWSDHVPPGALFTIRFNGQVNYDVPMGRVLINRGEVTHDGITATLYASAATEVQGQVKIYLPIVAR